MLAAQGWQARRNPAALRAVGPVGHVVNLAVFLALHMTWWYVPVVDVLSDAALLVWPVDALETRPAASQLPAMTSGVGHER